MKPAAAFLFFLLFLAGIALVNLRSMRPEGDMPVRDPTQLIGPAWRSTHLGEMRMAADSPAFIQFDADGRVSGNAGCNRFFGDWKLSAGILEFGQLGMTRMGCPEPANSLEIAFLEQLGQVRSAVRAGNRLGMADEAGRTVMQFSSDTPRSD